LYRVLSEATLRSGETVEIGLILSPDADHAEEIKPFLGHKGGNWNWHVARAVAEDLDGLQTRFYVAKLDGKIIANVMTLESAHCGILGHVFTDPDQRRKGAISCVFDALMPDFDARGGVMVLGTGFESHAYWIYHGRGFRSITGDSGFMRYATEDDYEDKLFAPADATARPVLWRDWPRIAVMSARSEGWWLRSVWLGHQGRTNFEGPFLELKRPVENGKAHCAVLDTEADVLAGYATLTPDPRWKGSTWLLDLDVHPNFEDQAAKLVEALPMPDAKVQCHVDAAAVTKAAALEAQGFTVEATLKNQVRRDGEALDVMVYAK